MRALSAHTTHSDPYRAGAELGQALADIDPEVIFLFESIHYRGSADIVEAILDEVARDDVLLIGTTGDGFYETSHSAEVGASALALSTEGAVQWVLAKAHGASSDPKAAIGSCFDSIHRRLEPMTPSLAFVVAGIRTDGNALTEAINERASYPVFGGLAGDDRRMRSSWVFAGREAIDDGLVVIAAAGELPYEVHLARGLTPVGAPGRITQAAPKCVQRVEDDTAMSFIEAQTGKPIAAIDKGITAFSVTDPATRDEAWHLSIANFDETDGSIRLFGSVEEGQEVQVCFAHPRSLIEAIEAIRQQAGRTRLHPVAGLIVSCAGRKWVLGHEIDREVKAAMSGSDHVFPIAGFPSFGEIAPMKRGPRYTRALFHNVTYVLTMFGER